MKRRRAVAIAAAIAVLACLGTASVQAQPLRLQDQANAWRQIEPLLRRQAHPPANQFDFEPTFAVETGSGYKVRVAAIGSSIAVIVGRGNSDVAGYLARGVATSRRLQASFGPFGQVDMRFRPSASAPEPSGRRHGCHGRRRHSRISGTWSGRFRFTSEGHRVTVDIHRAAGSIRRRAAVCFSPHRQRTAVASGGPFSSFSFFNAVTAGWHEGLESAQLLGLETGAGTLFIASTQSSLSAVAILHVAVAAVEKPGTLAVNGALTHAEISPPAPFHGTGIYKAAPDGSTTWTGDLTVNFPDAPRFPLTGEKFEAEVRRAL